MDHVIENLQHIRDHPQGSIYSVTLPFVPAQCRVWGPCGPPARVFLLVLALPYPCAVCFFHSYKLVCDPLQPLASFAPQQ